VTALRGAVKANGELFALSLFRQRRPTWTRVTSKPRGLGIWLGLCNGIIDLAMYCIAVDDLGPALIRSYRSKRLERFWTKGEPNMSTADTSRSSRDSLVRWTLQRAQRAWTYRAGGFIR
jgi:hypothetical protein